MRTLLLCAFSVCSLGMASAQMPGTRRLESDAQMNSVLQELYNRSVQDGSDERAQRGATQREVEYERHLFYGKLKHFVDLWSRMTKQMNQRNTFDVKLARQVSQAFHDLETSEGWPVRNGH